MGSATIRRLVAADLLAYKVLRDDMLAAYPEAFTSSPTPERSAQSYHARLGLERADGGEFTLGAWDDEARLVGAITCERDPRPKVHHIGHLIGMMVRTEAQGSGTGRALLDACIAQARAADGLTMLTLTVTVGNDGAQHLYERAGFVACGQLPRAIRVDGRYHAKLTMRLMLD